jgi:hypothetical protein
MLVLALKHLNTRISLRVAAAAQGSPLDVLRTALLELLPLDAPRRFEARIGLAFQARAAVSEPVAAVLREGLPHVLAFYADQIRAAQAAGQLRADLDATKEADILFTFALGMVNPTLIGHYTPAQVTATLDYHLTRLIP